MELFPLQNLLEKIQGCTFASLDAETSPSPGILKITKGERVILFTNKHVSGYNNLVRRRLQEAGKDPNTFVLSDLPWGERLPNSPLIVNKGKYYLQCIRLAEGQSKFYFVGLNKDDLREVEEPKNLNLRTRRTNQGLPKEDEVVVSCYELDNIKRIALMDEVLVSEDNNIVPPLGA